MGFGDILAVVIVALIILGNVVGSARSGRSKQKRQRERVLREQRERLQNMEQSTHGGERASATSYSGSSTASQQRQVRTLPGERGPSTPTRAAGAPRTYETTQTAKPTGESESGWGSLRDDPFYSQRQAPTTQSSSRTSAGTTRQAQPPRRPVRRRPVTGTAQRRQLPPIPETPVSGADYSSQSQIDTTDSYAMPAMSSAARGKTPRGRVGVPTEPGKGIRFSENNIVNGFIFAEIFRPPPGMRPPGEL